MSEVFSILGPRIVESLLKFQSNWVLFHSLRAFGMALRTRKMLENSKQRSYFFGLITYLFLGFGGSSLSAFLQGMPSTFTSRSELIPIYIFFHALVFHLKPFNRIWNTLTVDTPIFVYLGITRGFSLANSMDAYRSHPMFKGQLAPLYSIPAQLLVGLLSSCGSGVMYKWMIEAWNECRSRTEKTEKQTVNTKQSVDGEKENLKKETVNDDVSSTLFGHPGFDLNLCFSVAALNVCLTYPEIPLHMIKHIDSITPLPPILHLLFRSPMSKGEIAVMCAILTSVAPLLKPKAR